MAKSIGVLLAGILLIGNGALAQSCPSLIPLSNNTTADANQVNSNFNTVWTCANNLASAITLSGGNVGIGTTTPAAKLTVVSNAYSGLDVYDWGNGQYGTGVRTLNTNGNASIFMESVASSYGKIQAGLAAAPYTSLPISLNPSGGSVGIGTTTPSYTLHVNGLVAGIGDYQNVSDERLKKNIVPITNALETLEKLRGVEFDWRDTKERTVGKSLNLPLRDHQIGFIAQEVKLVLPEAVSVSRDKDAIVSVAPTKMVPVLVEAVKSLIATNKTQALQIQKLQRQVSALEHKLDTRTAANDRAAFEVDKTAQR